MDINLEIPSEAGEQNEDDSSKICQDNNVSESDEEESRYHDDESTTSDEVFFEDISSSLINLRKEKVNGTRDSAPKQVSAISNPFENTLICTADLDFTSYLVNSQREELSHDNEQNELKNLSHQRRHGSWRAVNVTNHDSIQEIKEVEDENESLDSSGDFHLESNYQRQYTSATRRVYRHSQDSRVLTSTRTARIAVSESSVISSDFRMSISTFENGNSELEDESGSVFDEEELATNDKTSDNEGFVIN